MPGNRKSQNLIQSFRHAFSGIRWMICHERNARIHALLTILILVLCFWLRLEAGKVTLAVMAIAIVWVAEGLNSAFEALTDLVSPENLKKAKQAKDMAAGAVLIAAAAAIVVGIFVLGPALMELVPST